MKHYIFIVLLLCSIKLHSQLFGGAMVNSPKETITFTYKGQSVTYGVINSKGRKWLDRNLGASQVATSSTDTASYGDLFQWGRLDDGHQNRNSDTTGVRSTTDVPGNNKFIYHPFQSGVFIYDWRNPQNNNLWQGVSGINNPCPTGFRLPTTDEWTTEIADWSGATSQEKAFNSKLKLTVAGWRKNYSGDLNNVGFIGYYWSYTTASTSSRALYIQSDGPISNGVSESRANGFSVRCIKD